MHACVSLVAFIFSVGICLQPGIVTHFIDSLTTLLSILSILLSKSPGLFTQVDTNRIVHIHSVIILRRSDKRKDRVEISPEQLSSAATEAEISFVKHVSFMKKTNLCLLVVSCRRSVWQSQCHGCHKCQCDRWRFHRIPGDTAILLFLVIRFLSKSYRLADMTGRPMRVVGWYHSHPHITVWPSHVGKNQSTPLPHQFHNFSFHCHGKLFQLVCLRHSFSTTDVRTQAMYQMMDQGFVGLIFSCFIEDKNTKVGFKWQQFEI